VHCLKAHTRFIFLLQCKSPVSESADGHLLCQNVQVCSCKCRKHQLVSRKIFLQCPQRASSVQIYRINGLVPYLDFNEALDESRLGSAMSQSRFKDFSKYKYLLVMPWCGRNLHDMIDKESSTIDSKKAIVALVQSVKYMHDAGYVHGDLKPRNFVRYEDDYALINLHASAKILSLASWRKTSSAYLPPEAINQAKVREIAVSEGPAAVCRCSERFAGVPEVDSIRITNNKATLKFRSKHPFDQGQDICLGGFFPDETSSNLSINGSFCILGCNEYSIEFAICDEFGIAGEYNSQQVGSATFCCLGLCGLAHVAHDMWALGVLIFR
jgi:serine/threonine protein kinase